MLTDGGKVTSLGTSLWAGSILVSDGSGGEPRSAWYLYIGEHLSSSLR